MGIISSEQIFENMTASDLQTAAKMFFFLYTCPGVVNQDIQSTKSQKWFVNWFTFYDDLFKTSQDKILLTLNRIMTRTNDNGFNGKLFKRIAKLRNLEYERIQSLLPGDIRNNNNGSLKTFDHLTLNLKGKLFSSF